MAETGVNRREIASTIKILRDFGVPREEIDLELIHSFKNSIQLHNWKKEIISKHLAKY